MDLEIQDVAELFNVSESTIHRWISDGKIPSYRMNQLHADYRFSVGEIENWLIAHKLGPANDHEGRVEKTKPSRLGSKQFGLFRAIHKGAVLQDVPGRTKDEVIYNSMKAVAKDFHLDPEIVTELLLDRESLMPTALGNGIAVPHARDSFLSTQQDAVIVVFPEKQLEYGALDGKKVHTLFFLFTGEDKRHLHLLAKIAHLSSQQKSLDLFISKPKKNELLSYIKQWESEVSKSDK